MRDNSPRVGALAPEWQTGHCSYSHTEADLACLADARWHGIVLGEDLKGLECCDQHRPIMQAIAQYVHRLDSPCSLSDAQFIEAENRCVLPWDDGELALLAAVAQESVS